MARDAHEQVRQLASISSTSFCEICAARQPVVQPGISARRQPVVGLTWHVSDVICSVFNRMFLVPRVEPSLCKMRLQIYDVQRWRKGDMCNVENVFGALQTIHKCRFLVKFRGGRRFWNDRCVFLTISNKCVFRPVDNIDITKVERLYSNSFFPLLFFLSYDTTKKEGDTVLYLITLWKHCSQFSFGCQTIQTCS